MFTDANLYRRTPLLAPLACVLLEVLLYFERREQRALRMVFMRDRRPKQREDAIPGRLRRIALLAMHRVHHQVERGIDGRAFPRDRDPPSNRSPSGTSEALGDLRLNSGLRAVEIVSRKRARVVVHLLPIPFLGRRHSQHKGSLQPGFHSRTLGSGG